MDPYELFEISREADSDEIKKRYRLLSKLYHPDTPNGDAEKFKEIASAWEILSDPEKKKMYDELGYVADKEKMHKKAQELVHQVFSTLVGQYGMEGILSLDVMHELKSLMDMGIQEVDKKVMEAKQNIASTQKVLAKFKFKDDHNPIKDMLDNTIHKHETTIKQMKGETVIAKLTYDLLKNYEFDSDTAQFKAINFGLGGGSVFNSFTGSF